jgi:hypothetical protein
MTTSKKRFFEQDMKAVHERLIHAAEARERLPEVDLDRVSRIASAAYWAATREGEDLEQAERRALAALEEASADSERMRETARKELEQDKWGSKFDAEPQRGFVSDFLFAFGLPGIAVLAVAWLGLTYSEVVAKLTFFTVAAVFVGASIAALAARFSARGFRKSLGTGTTRTLLMQSGGAIIAGFFLFVSAGFLVHLQDQRNQVHEMEVHLEKLNQAAAVALAALNAGATVSATQKAVSKTTAVNWIKVEGLPNATGAVLAGTGFTQRQMGLEVRVAGSPSKTSVPSLVSFITLKSGEKEAYADYVVGTVLKADLDKVTIEVGPEDRRVLGLPQGTLPPPVKSRVVAAVNRADRKAVFLQTIDSVVSDLKR